MAILQKAVFALISTLCFYKFSQAQECQIDFHIESASVMVLAGEDASALCDASCFGHSGDISVVWLDTAGRQIDKQSGRISTVLENDGLMNRLLIQSSSAAESGTYMCSVTRDGEVLEEKALSFYIFGNFDYEDKKPIDEGPRRGDIVPRRELDYRPVRSLDWILKRLTSLRTSSDLDTKGSRIQENGVQINRRKNVSDGSVSGVSALDQERESAESSVGQEGKIQIVLENTEPSAVRFDDFETKFDSRTGKHSHRPGNTADFLYRSRKENEEQGRQAKKPGFNYRRLLSYLELSDAELVGDVFDELEAVHSDGDYNDESDLSRVKRQAENSSTVDPDSAQENNGNSSATTTTTETSWSETTDEQMTDNATSSTTAGSTTLSDQSTTTHSKDDRNTESSSSSFSTMTSTTETDDNENGGNGGPADRNTDSSCPKEVHQLSDFGKYGSVAFAVALAVAFLMLFILLMIIFMPRILSRKKDKVDVETAIYRRKGPDDMDTAPLTLLNDPVDLGGEEDPRILNLVDPDTSLSSDEEEAATENYKEDSGQVSTFLLRQQSLGEQNENADKDSSVKNSQEDKPKLLTSTDAGTPHRPADGTGPDTVVNV